MSTVELRENLHQLIDEIDNSSLLQTLHDILEERKNAKHGRLWDSLRPSQQQEVLDAFEESEDPKNLTPHEEVLNKYK